MSWVRSTSSHVHRRMYIVACTSSHAPGGWLAVIRRGHGRARAASADYFSSMSSRNSDDESLAPHWGHLPALAAMVSLSDFSIFMVVIFAPHLPHSMFTDMVYTSPIWIKTFFVPGLCHELFCAGNFIVRLRPGNMSRLIATWSRQSFSWRPVPIVKLDVTYHVHSFTHTLCCPKMLSPTLSIRSNKLHWNLIPTTFYISIFRLRQQDLSVAAHASDSSKHTQRATHS